jgi:hypothetical protein
MYEYHRLCADLTPSDTCLVVEQYREGLFIRQFHEHVPNRRLSMDRRVNLLRALVLGFSQASGETIVRCYLNERRGGPSADSRLRICRSLAEPGVERLYCGTNTKAWCDQVTDRTRFRSEGSVISAGNR